MGDIKGLFEKVKEVISTESQKKLTDNLEKGVFTLRNMRDQYSSVLKMGPLDKVVNMIPGMSNMMIPQGKEKEASGKIKRYLCMMDSMTDEELDRKKKIDESRMKRIARGCGCLPQEVADMLEEYNKFSKMVEKMPKLSGKGGKDMSQLTRNPGQFAQQLSSMVPQNLLTQMGGTGNLMNMVKELSQMEGLQGQLGGAKRKGKR